MTTAEIDPLTLREGLRLGLVLASPGDDSGPDEVFDEPYPHEYVAVRISDEAIFFSGGEPGHVLDVEFAVSQATGPFPAEGLLHFSIAQATLGMIDGARISRVRISINRFKIVRLQFFRHEASWSIEPRRPERPPASADWPSWRHTVGSDAEYTEGPWRASVEAAELRRVVEGGRGDFCHIFPNGPETLTVDTIDFAGIVVDSQNVSAAEEFDPEMTGPVIVDRDLLLELVRCIPVGGVVIERCADLERPLRISSRGAMQGSYTAYLPVVFRV